MLTRFPSSRRWLTGSTALVAAVLAAAPAGAQNAAPPAAGAVAPSTNATVNLIRLLIQNKIITRIAGEALLAQAEADAAQARAALAQAAPAAIAPAPGARATAAPAAPAEVASGELPPPPPGSIRVPYIPESLRAKITEDIKNDVLAQADFEGWARPNQIPDWVKGVKISGDLRFRSESVFYSRNNALEQLDFGAFNAGGPLDINANTNPTGFPLLNTRTNRPDRLRIRARLGITAQVNPFAQVGFRFASGDDNSPISTNQILGGGFAKKDFWIDQAYLRLTPVPWVSATFGRMANPFKYTELLFDNDLNFDGVSVTADANRFLPAGGRASVVAGAFPLGYAGNTFPTTALAKAGEGSNKWLFSGQLRGGYTFGDNLFDVDLSAAYHSFKSVQGRLSTSCALYNGNRQCSTDQYQPFFLRKGNTLFFLRDIAADPANPNNFAQPQLLGLTFDYDVLDITATVKLPVAEGIDVSVEGDYIRNLSFRKGDLCRNDPKGLPINNITVAQPIAGATPGTPAADFYTNPCTPRTDIVNGVSTTRIATFDGGNQGWSVKAVLGKAKPKKWGEWNVEASYRYLESDATLDSLADSDFRLGGTNARGYIIGGTLGLYKGVNLTGRWLSGNAISGPPLAIDVLQFDLSAEF